MRAGLLCCIIVAAIATATWLYTEKSAKEQSGIESYSVALQSVHKVLSPDGGISLKYVDVDPTIYLWTRYLLAPHYISVYDYEHFDTTISVCKVNASDSVITSFIADKRLLWEHKDKNFHYFLTSSR
jgi:hypothetical protein